jgi:flagellar biosynthesis/type III secretory pathway protein FliH
MPQVMSYIERKGWREGRKQGRAEGREEGRKEGALEVITWVLTRRIGAFDDATTHRLRALTLDALYALADVALTFTSQTDLQYWLNDQQP